MKAIDFDLPKDLQFNFKTGITSFLDNRLVIFDANAIGLLRHELISTIGTDKAREFFLRFGYQNGYADFIQIKIGYSFDSEMDLLASGPVIHTWEGIVQATPKEISYDRGSGKFYFSGIWTNSYEAQQHLMYSEHGTEPVCWSLIGYASGWCTAFFGKPLLALEPICMGKGDDHCEWLIQPVDVWGTEADVYRKALESFWKE